jgi:hypothetical protein
MSGRSREGSLIVLNLWPHRPRFSTVQIALVRDSLGGFYRSILEGQFGACACLAAEAICTGDPSRGSTW